MAEEPRVALLLSDDLIFTSRVTGTARDLGLTVKAARSSTALQALAAQQPPACLIVDLQNPGLDIAALVNHLAQSSATRPFIVAYGSHVATAVLKAAREVGCDLVLPRSKFVEDLPLELPRWIGA
jgi:CheY-like chemotaxis protein